MSNILVVEHHSHVATGKLAATLNTASGLSVTTIDTVPADLTSTSVLILNSLPRDYDIAQDRIVTYLNAGGAILCLHDTLFPGPHNQSLLATIGVRYAFDAITVDQNQGRYIYNLAVGNPDDPNLCFPIRVVPENATHPIVDMMTDFEIADELWPINTAPGVKQLLTADVGDRIPCHPRFRQPVTVCGCRAVGKGRAAFLLLGHFPQTYANTNILCIIEHAVRWLNRELNESEYAFDLFLSFSSADKTEAQKLNNAALANKLKVFMSEKDLKSGDVWDEKIRQALFSSREMAVLVTPTSLKSEWVITEWGIAWALQKRITPVLLRCNVNQLPDRLRRYEARDLHEMDLYIQEILSRKGAP
jgi:hypothetical protein